MKFKLNGFIRETYLLSAVRINPDSKYRERINYAFKVGQTYNTDDLKQDTPNIKDLVESKSIYLPHRPETVKQLQTLGVPYDTKGCKSCGVSFRQLRINVFEVVQ